jgi:hypothetical protein
MPKIMIINQDFLLNQIYPVGSLYLTTNATNPSKFLGGTWEQITSDAYLKIVSSDAGSLGGTSSDHKIPIESIPSHNHTPTDGHVVGASISGGSSVIPVYQYHNYNSAYRTGLSGGGEAYYPYYYGIYVWKRVG